MKQPLLFEVQAVKTANRLSRRLEVNRLKQEFGIYTHNNKDLGWLAFPIYECRACLNGYQLTEEQSDPVVMFAHFSRLLEDAGLIEDGHKTEYEAVIAVINYLKNKRPSPSEANL